MPPATLMPVVFVSHGAPTMALDPVAARDFGALGRAVPRPVAILVLSAHWLESPPTVGTRTTRELLHDYSGFPTELRQVRYPPPPRRLWRRMCCDWCPVRASTTSALGTMACGRRWCTCSPRRMWRCCSCRCHGGYHPSACTNWVGNSHRCVRKAC